MDWKISKKKGEELELKNNTKNKVISGLFWRYGEKLGAQGVQFILTIILARLLSPADYGMIALITVFIDVCTVFIESGFGSALIQKKDADDLDFSTVFYFNIAMAMLLICILYILSPYIAEFYKEEKLTNVLRVLSINLLIGGLNNVQYSYVSKLMQFKKFFFATLIGTIISAMAGIVMAYNGCGVWSLVAQRMINQAIDTIFLWFTVKWRPIFKFSIARFKKLYNFAWKLLCSNLIIKIYTNMYNLIIGKVYTSQDLGYYNRGQNIPSFAINNINSSLDSVLYPALSECQENKIRVKEIMRRSVSVSTFLIFPMMAGLTAVAKPLTLLLLTEKWLPSVPFMQFCCITYALLPIQTANLQAINALGRSDIYLKLEIAKKIIGIVLLFVSIRFGIYAMMIARCVDSFIAFILNAYPNKKLLSYGFKEQIKDIVPALIISLIMGIIVYCVLFFKFNIILTIIIQVFVGVSSYILMAKIFKLNTLEYIFNIIKDTRLKN